MFFSTEFCLKLNFEFRNIITDIHLNNKKDNQKLKHGGKELREPKM